MDKLEKITQENYRSKFNKLGLFGSLFIGGLLTYFGVVKANPITTNSDCYFGTVTQNITNDSLQNIEAKIINVTQGQEDVDTTDVNGYFNICTVGIDERDIKRSVTFGVRNYPNPFSNRMTFDLKIPEESKGKVSLDIYDISGRLVRTLVDSDLDVGNYKYSWDGRDNNGREVSNGNYFYRITANNNTQTNKIVFIKSGNNQSNLYSNADNGNNKRNLITNPNEVNITSVLPDSLIFSLMDTSRFYSWIEANPPVGENNRIMITLGQDDYDSILRDKLEHLKYICLLEDIDTVYDHRLVRWLPQHMPIKIFQNLTDAVPYDSIADTLSILAAYNWENKSNKNLFIVNNDSLLGNIGITFEYPDSIPGGDGSTDIDSMGISPLHPLHVKIRIGKRLLELYPNDALAVFGHELGHALMLIRHGLSANEIMHPAAPVPEPSDQEGQIVAEIYGLPPGHLMGPYRYKGDQNPGPTSSSSIDHEKILEYFPFDPKKFLKFLPEYLKFENSPK